MHRLNLEDIKNKLRKPLPGLLSQLKMAPPNRVEQLLNNNINNTANARKSAVLILLFYDSGILKTAFIKRSEYEGVHSGQIAFPGGRFETEDITFQTTALRETWEEIGVRSNEVEIIGQLTDVYIPPSNFLVKVFVGFCAQKPLYVIDKKEVQHVVEIEIEDLLNDKAKGEMEILSSITKSKVTVPCYSINGVEIWGATAMIISELSDTLQQ